MINCRISYLVQLLGELQLQFGMLRIVENGGIQFDETLNDAVDTINRERLQGWLVGVAPVVVDEYEFNSAAIRIDRFSKKLNSSLLTNGELKFEIKALTEAIEDELKHQFIYRYPKEKAEVLKNWKSDWEAPIERFRAISNDVLAGVDLWALNHNTASVFHFMRVLEVGLASLADALDLRYSTQTWGKVIGEIERAIKLETQKPKSLEKEARMQFLSEAAKEFSYFKDGWRNFVSHKKCEYDGKQARSVMEHVRQFMTTLAEHLPVDQGSSMPETS